MYLGLSAKWKANTYNYFGLFNLIAIKNTHMLSTCQTSPPWLTFIFFFWFVYVIFSLQLCSTQKINKSETFKTY
jgi:hypothetical protein